MKKLLFILLFIAGSVLRLTAQERQIQGIIYDEASKQRLSRVYIYDTRSNKGVYNNLKGEFTITVQRGDTLIVALQGYAVDTATVQSQNVLIFYLKRTSIILPQVNISDTLQSPQKQLEATQQEYKDIYDKGNSKDLLSVRNGGGAGLSIDALYSLLSKEGKNARFLQRIIERDYREAVVSYRYTRSLVADVTNLQGEKLRDFMQQYRPDYYFVLEANDYSFITFIKSSYTRYLQNPNTYRLPALK